MILSFHPIIEAHQNIICAGREPNEDDLAAIQKADAVILPQGCSETLYRMARMNCPHIFPNMDTRFDYPGKCGQIRLFRHLELAHPETQLYANVAEFNPSELPLDFPLVVKLDWGGEGETVYKVENTAELTRVMDRIVAFENSGQFGFLIQDFIPTRHRSLRVVLINTQSIVYWRIQTADQPFGTSVNQGARIDHEVHTGVKAAVQKVVERIGRRTRLQLAGFDFIFNRDMPANGCPEPLILEINYFFGRSGLGGSDAYYRLLENEVDKWLATLGLNRS